MNISPRTQMTQVRRFAGVLLLTLVIFAYLSVVVFDHLTSGWTRRDIEIRSRLATDATRLSITNTLTAADSPGLVRVLEGLTKDQRIHGVALCKSDGTLLGQTPNFSEIARCDQISTLRQTSGQEIKSEPSTFYLTAVALEPANPTSPVLVFVHDMSFAARRSALTSRYIFTMFFALGLLLSMLAFVLIRRFWEDWSQDLKTVIRDKGSLASLPNDASREWLPVVREVRSVMRELDGERRSKDGVRVLWNSKSLKDLLSNRLAGNEVIAIANREPFIHDYRDGEIVVRHPASGLVTALEPVMRACAGTWIGHGSGSADRETVDEFDRIQVPPGENAYTIRRIWMTEEEERGYYYGFSNEGLWPLCHIAHTRPVFRMSDWQAYLAVNERFANAVKEEAKTESPVILVQDYHHAVLPAVIRKRIPKATIITFWHVPWPNPEAFGICPWREEILEGMLGSTILGFHTRFHRNNFFDTVDRFLECRIDREHSTISYRGEQTEVRSYPISIAWPTAPTDITETFDDARKTVCEKHGLNPDCKIAVGIDRLDYTKGIIERFSAVERFFELHPEWIGRFTLIQIAAPSRDQISTYKHFAESVDHEAERINARFSDAAVKPILLMKQHHGAEQVTQYQRAADICLVTSLHDGMNLVAKEFIASRDDEQGVLILSMFAGASRELPEALIVNPYNADQCARAIYAALEMSPAEQAQRMISLRDQVREFNVYRWAGIMLNDATRVRTRMQLEERLSETNQYNSVQAL